MFRLLQILFVIKYANTDTIFPCFYDLNQYINNHQQTK